MNEIIRAEDLTKTYRLGETNVEALRGVSININKGELVSIIGPSGSGKSTLMHLLGCLDTPTSGKYFLEGEDVSKLNDTQLATIRNKKIGFVFQTFNLLPHLTVLDNVILPVVYNAKSNLRETERKAMELLEIAGIKERAKHLPAQLSGGERQRVAIIRALINDPLIVFADEPTGNLDSKTGLEIIKILKELNEEKGVTEIIVTHDSSITQFTHKIIHIKDGLIEKEIKNGHVANIGEIKK
ncbi:MAG: ABC transporter ATP-binding protein [Caldisericaceae bacterium]|nr:ABC transporter ATP-binding protein [Caldisericaceae bacterium]